MKEVLRKTYGNMTVTLKRETGPAPKRALPFKADELREYMRGLDASQQALFDRRGHGAKAKDVDELYKLAGELMDAHYELSVVTDALAQLDAMIDQVGERLDAYHVVFGTGTETIYAPTQALWTDKYTDECADEDIPF